jgi:REP element-mobilizing transposase RayT
MPYNPNYHHRRSIRVRDFDYSRPGLYFITICTKHHFRLFGEIREDEMKLNDAGIVANNCWLEIPVHYPSVSLHDYVIMPNHVHGIIELTHEFHDAGSQHRHAGSFPDDDVCRNVKMPFATGTHISGGDVETHAVVGVQNFEPLRPGPRYKPCLPVKRNEYQQIIPRSVGSIVRGYKTGVTKWFRANTKTKTVWQRNFWEHIIRDYRSYHAISTYIRNNPAKWSEDRFSR